MNARGPVATLVLWVLVAAGLVSAPGMLYQGARRVVSSLAHLPEGPLAARRRVFGADYVDGVSRITSAVPRDGEYLLADRSREPGQPNWIRYDLAPRRAQYVGRFSGTSLIVPKEGLPKERPPFVVIAVDSEQAPELVPSDRFFHTTRVFDSGRNDDAIPASIDAPRPAADVTGELVVVGWCQERGGHPCSEMLFVLDDDERLPTRFERYPRPDVAAVLPEMGNCERAGYRASFSMKPGDAGEHRLRVSFLTQDGRCRRLEVPKFRWRP